MKNNKRFESLIFAFILLIFTSEAYAQQKKGSLKDNDGNTYSTVIIGDQEWMVENLKTTKFNDGTPISNETDMTRWVQITTPAYSWYNNDAASKKVFGAVYNWYAVNTGKLCPAGWSVPSDDDWTKLTDFLGGIEAAGGKLKETGTSNWNTPNTGATNETGFSAVPGGYRYGYFWGQGTFYETGLNGYYWTATQCTDTHSWTRTLNAERPKVYRSIFVKNNGFSVRCIKGS